jgi:hypothetical protein
MTLKQGPNWGYRAQNGVIKLGCNTLNPKPGSNLGYGPQNGVRIGLFTLKLDLDLWTAFGYTGFSVYRLFGRGAFGYRGFWVYGLFGTQAYISNFAKITPKITFQNFAHHNFVGAHHNFVGA